MYNLLIGISYNAFLRLLINFGFDEDTVVFSRQKLLFCIGGWLDLLKIYLSQSVIKVMVGSNTFIWVYLSKKPTLLLMRVLFHDQKLLL